MKNRITALIIAAIASGTGCSQQTELNEAKKKIARLESELAAEKAKTPTAKASEPGSVTSQISATPDETKTPSGDQWNYRASEDKMTGGTTYHATVLSTNTVNFRPPYGGDQHGLLSLRTDPKYGKDLIFSIEKGQLLCRSYEDCQVMVRFDDGKPENFSGIGPADNSSETVFVRNYERFVRKLRKSKIVRVSTNIYQEGAPVFEFDVSGFSQEKYIPKNGPQK